MKSDLVDIAAELKVETPAAFKIFDGKTTEWVPKSQVERNDDGTWTMPEWLAKEKGFI
ncbi:hypothetical protein HAP47_0023170 [Bradyrhizobium sp. 41S5]|uniref:hypothetical protein n=1 Tax=Bradyrhizobium sp. 41S5 TaxID=1404443 RepID=UPI00156A7B21|nr:hypothetical protein [Bradyrhizobium sp. 41S5]UFX42164.1 hypothetical protein HAP47_0023170 [Bradyrhizobium sp. 41S5]